MLKKKPTKSFVELLKGARYDIFCDSCGNMAHDHEVFADNGKYCLSSTGNNYPLCSSCYSRNLLSTLNKEQLNGRGLDECAHCKSSLNLVLPTINESVKFICSDCLRTKGDPSNAHNFNGIRHWQQCERCGTVRIHKNGRDTFWILGNPNPQDKPSPVCQPGYSGMSDLQNKCNHNHSYVTLDDSTKDRKEVKAITKADLKSANDMLSVPGYEEMIPINEYDLAFSRCGYKLQWCRSCGHLNRELPEWWSDVI